MPESLVLKPVAISCKRPISGILRKAKNAIEKLKEHLMLAFSVEERVKQIIEATSDYLNDYIGKNYSAKKSEVELVIADTNGEWAEARAKGYVFPLGKYKSKEEFMNACLKDPQKGTYDKKFSRIVINMQTINETHENNKKAQKACLIATTMHEYLHHLCGFERYYPKGNLGPDEFGKTQFDILWLIDGMNELLLRDIMHKLYEKEEKALTCTSYSQEFLLIIKLEQIISHETLIASYFEGSMLSIKLKLKEAGLSEDEIKKLLKNGHKLVRGNKKEKEAAFEEIEKCLNRLIGKKKRAKQIKDEDEGCINQWEEIYGKQGKPELEAWQKLPADERRARLVPDLVSKKLFPGEFHHHDQAMDFLKDNFNGYSEFHANIAINLVTAHLSLETGRQPSEHEIITYLEYLSNSFSKLYTVRPNMRQLASEAAIEIYNEHSHSLPIAKLIGVDEAKIQRRMNEIGSLPKDPEKIPNLLGINANNEELHELVGIAYSIQLTLNNGTSNEAVCEALLCAKERLGNQYLNADKIKEILTSSFGKDISTNSLLQEKVNYESCKEYIREHYFRVPEAADESALRSISKNLELVYPGAIFRFDPKTGFTRYVKTISDNNAFMIPDPPGGSGGGGSMGKFNPYGMDFSQIFEMHKIEPVDPFAEGTRIQDAKASIKQGTDFQRFSALFDEYVSGGSRGLRFDAESERPSGFLTPEEVLERKYALCLEHAYLFLSLTRMQRTFAFKVFRDEEGNLIPHIANGVFFDPDTKDNLTIDRLIRANYKPRIFYYLFEEDSQFRERLKSEVHLPDAGKFMVLDLSQNNFGAQYNEVRVMTTPEELLSAYFVDRGTYRMVRNKQDEALADFETALGINDHDELARSHLVAYFSDIQPDPERVLELTSDFSLLVNTEDIVSRAFVLVSLGDMNNAIEALSAAIQMSEHAVKARAFIKQLLR